LIWGRKNTLLQASVKALDSYKIHLFFMN